MITPKIQIQSINLSTHLLSTQIQTLNFLFYTQYDIVFQTFQHKHVTHFHRGKQQDRLKFKTQDIKRHFEKCSERLHIRLLRDSLDLDRLLQKLQFLWQNKNIPHFHRYYFQKYVFTADFYDIQNLMKSQEMLIRQQQHIYYSILRAINARQACLKQFKHNVAQLQQNDVYQYLHVAKQRIYIKRKIIQQTKQRSLGYKVQQIQDQIANQGKVKLQYFSDSFNHLTKLTVYVIDLIIKWKDYIRQLTHDQHKKRERIEYFFNEQNYLLKILSDLRFLNDSFFAKFYEFASKNDPFLFMPLLCLQKKVNKNLDDELLKVIFMPVKQLIPEIMLKYDELNAEYKHNIKSRRIYDLRMIKMKNQSPQSPSKSKNQENLKLSNVVLKKIQPKRSQSLKMFRVKEIQKQNKIRDFSRPKYGQQKIVMEVQSPLKNSGVTIKPPKKLQQVVNSQMFQLLKDEVVKKIKKQFQQDKTKKVFLAKNIMNDNPIDFSKLSSLKNQTLQTYIDDKVQEAMTNIFLYESQKQIKVPNIQISIFSIEEYLLEKQIQLMYKKSIFELSQMQISQKHLLKVLQQAQFCYFLKAELKQLQLGRAICILDRQCQKYKRIKVVYVTFNEISQLQMLLLRFVQFLWRYENSMQIIFTFFQPIQNKQIKKTIQNIHLSLQTNCVFTYKNIGTKNQITLTFKRNHKNINFIPNKYPFSISINLRLLLSHERLFLESSPHQNLEIVNYDILLMQVINKYLPSDEFVMLKEKVTWKNRFRKILDIIVLMEDTNSTIVNIKTREAPNITELNKQLKQQQQKLFEVSDIIKNNIVKLLELKLNLSLPFAVKSVYFDNAQYYRYKIEDKVCYWKHNKTQYFIFPSKERKDLKIMLFNAQQFMQNHSKDQQPLENYIDKLIKGENIIKHMAYLWVLMTRYPKQYHQKQDIISPTFKIQDFKCIKKQMFIADEFQWFCNMEMENSIQYQVSSLDFMLQKPLGIAIIGLQNTLVYARVLF